MEKITFRAVATNFWRLPAYSSWTPEERLSFLYLTTNEHTQSCGVYVINPKEGAVHTGYSFDAFMSLLARLEERGVIKFNPETFEVAVKHWFSDHPLLNPNMAICAAKEAQKIVDKTLLVFVELSAEIEHSRNRGKRPSDPLPGNGSRTVPKPLPMGSETDLDLALEEESPPDSLPTEELVVTNSARDEEPPSATPPGPAEGPDLEGEPKIAELLADIERSGKARASKFTVTPLVREKIIALARISASAAAKAWKDFLDKKGPRLYIAQVTLVDLPEFLDKRLELLNKPPPPSVFPNGALRHNGIDSQRKAAEVDPLTDKDCEEMANFVKSLGKPRQGAATA